MKDKSWITLHEDKSVTVHLHELTQANIDKFNRDLQELMKQRSENYNKQKEATK